METYYGHVRTPADAIVLFEACRLGLLPRVQRRLSEKERQSIRSGSVFVWDEREAGMRRWTDGKSWSASRVSGSFLTYREMEGKRGGGSVSQSSTSRAGRSPESRDSDDDRATDEGPDGYRYKPDGLMKQSFSITTSNGQHLHLISYYSRSHPSAANLQQPTSDPALRHVRPQKGLYPESTVNDQQNLPVVTRGPMAGATYPITPHPMGAYPRAQPPYPPSYAWPPTPLATPPTAPVQYGHGPASGFLPQLAATGPPPYGQHPSSHQHLGQLPPPPHLHSYERQPMESLHQAPSYMSRSPRSIHERPLEQRSPQVYGQVLVDPRMSSPRLHGQPLVPSLSRSPRLVKQEPPVLHSLNPISGSPKSTDPANVGNSVPGISALMNGAALPPLSSPAAPPGAPTASPRGAPAPRPTGGPQDIPNDKIGFGGEDVRALRQLDRAFIA